MSETESLRRHEERKKHPFAWWMSWFLLAGSILVLLYTYYRAEMVLQGEQRGAYFKYYVIALTGVLFWGVVLRLRADMRAKIVTATISLLASLYLVEGGLTFFGLGQPFDTAAERREATAAKLGIEFDERTKLEVIENLIEEGEDAVPVVEAVAQDRAPYLPERDQHFQQEAGAGQVAPHLLHLGGVANKTTVGGNESGEFMIYRSDRHGFNNPDTQWDSRTIEWLLVGDSFAHGYAVKPGQEIAGQIRSTTRTNAISLGMSGNGPLAEYASLVEYGKALAPEKVLWVYYEDNDLCGDLQREKKHPLLMQYMQDGFSQNLINRQREIDEYLEEYIAKGKEERESHFIQVREKEKEREKALLYKIRWIRLYAIRSIIGLAVEAGVGVDVDVDDPLFTEILTKAKARVEAWGGELYFVYLPDYSRYNKKVISQESHFKKSEVIDVVKGLGIPVIDIHQEVFADHSDPLSLFPFGRFGHYNKEGYSEVAKAIIANIKE